MINGIGYFCGVGQTFYLKIVSHYFLKDTITDALTKQIKKGQSLDV
jgi:hypothetical protein